MKEAKESISFYRNGRAYAAKHEGGHITGDYDIVSETTSEDGTRTIVLKPHDLSEHLKRVDELVNILASNLDPSSKVLPALLKDTLIDYPEEEVTKILNKITKQKAPVKVKEGCFDIIIGDGRRKSASRIMLHY